MLSHESQLVPLYTTEKMLAKYSEVCHRCGNKGHMVRECSVSNWRCAICGGAHRLNECPNNGASLQNIIKNRKHEVGLAVQAESS